MNTSDLHKKTSAESPAPSVLFWGRADFNYSRNSIVRQALQDFGWRDQYFQPRLSSLGDLEARFHHLPRPNLVWVPCFRQRDIGAASRFCHRQKVPLLVDPLISAFDKQVFERRKFLAESFRGKRLLAGEQAMMAKADLVLADTWAHAAFFHDVLHVPEEKIVVVPVGADEALFIPQKGPAKGDDPVLEVLFYGSFIPLQGPQVIVEAARIYQGPPVIWRLVGEGPLLADCRRLAEDLPQVQFEPWIPYRKLPERIGRADILLGIFGSTPKAARVIPNKVYQAAACSRPLVTLGSPAYPHELLQQRDSGFSWVKSGNPVELAEAVARLAEHPEKLPSMGEAVRASYDTWLALDQVRKQMGKALGMLGFATENHG